MASKMDIDVIVDGETFNISHDGTKKAILSILKVELVPASGALADALTEVLGRPSMQRLYLTCNRLEKAIVLRHLGPSWSTSRAYREAYRYYNDYLNQF